MDTYWVFTYQAPYWTHSNYIIWASQNPCTDEEAQGGKTHITSYSRSHSSGEGGREGICALAPHHTSCQRCAQANLHLRLSNACGHPLTELCNHFSELLSAFFFLNKREPDRTQSRSHEDSLYTLDEVDKPVCIQWVEECISC